MPAPIDSLSALLRDRWRPAVAGVVFVAAALTAYAVFGGAGGGDAPAPGADGTRDGTPATTAPATGPGAAETEAEDLARHARRLSALGFATDVSRRSVALDLLLSGGPGKDGIPALSDPAFETPAEAALDDEVRGVLVDFAGERRYYPFNILVWHEIANDSIGDTHFAVTFCPLCGSGIVFDREVGGEVLEFGVSGLLYESNLVMYDRRSDSLWSQSLGEAIVGRHTGTRLDILPMQLLAFGEARRKYPDMLVLSDDTGHSRDYGRNPYAGYEDTERLVFPVSGKDERFHAKELMYVFRLGERSVAFPLADLSEDGAGAELEGVAVSASRDGGEIVVTLDGASVPGYVEMWFSWAAQHGEDGVVWDLGP